MEAEYVAASSAIQEVIWHKQLLEELSFNQELPITVLSDNTAAISVAHQDSNHPKAKHIGIKYHHIRESVKHKVVDLKWIDTKNQLADILTKALPPKHFEQLRSSLMDV